MGSFDELEQIREQALVDLTGPARRRVLEACGEDRYLGRKGEITLRARTSGPVTSGEPPGLWPTRERDQTAPLVQAYEARAEEISHAELETRLATEAIDVTLPGRPVTGPPASHHSRRCVSFMRSGKMGFEAHEAPDVELEAYNFDLLNIPEYHLGARYGTPSG